MRFVWSLPFVILALIASQTPAKATINRLVDAEVMAGSCDGNANRFAQGEYDQAIRTLNAAMRQSLQGDIQLTAPDVARYGAAVRQLYLCKMQEMYRHLIVDAELSCNKLVSSTQRVVVILQMQGEIFGELPQPFVDAVFSNFQTAAKKCWAELAAKCINMDDRSKARRAADIIYAAESAGLTRADLQPPLRPCSSTLPYCAPGEPQEDCTRYLQEVADILFGDEPLPVIGAGFGPGGLRR